MKSDKNFMPLEAYCSYNAHAQRGRSSNDIKCEAESFVKEIVRSLMSSFGFRELATSCVFPLKMATEMYVETLEHQHTTRPVPES
jgi:hypothetical protein